MNRIKFEEKYLYTEIVDEQAHALSEAIDIPNDMDCLEQELVNADFGNVAILIRPATGHEAKAYCIETPEDAVAILILFQSTVHRLLVDNTDGQLDETIQLWLQHYCDNSVVPDDEDFTIGQAVAAYIGACQGRSGYEFDEVCHKIKTSLNADGLEEPSARYMVHACLLYPEVDLKKIAGGIDRPMHAEPYFLNTVADQPLSSDTRAELIHVLQQKGVSIDEGEATRWIEYCGTRTFRFDSTDSPEDFVYLYEPIFGDIDRALKDHQFFSSLINGPMDWAKPTLR